MEEVEWSTYESNVQSYRSNMIASQSFLIAVGAILFKQNICLEFLCILVALFQLWFIWFRIIRVRTIIVDFYKFKLGNIFDRYGNLRSEKDVNPLLEDVYVRNRSIRKKVNNKLAELYSNKKYKHNMRATRCKIDLCIPISFTFIWIAFLLCSLWEK